MVILKYLLEFYNYWSLVDFYLRFDKRGAAICNDTILLSTILKLLLINYYNKVC